MSERKPTPEDLGHGMAIPQGDASREELSGDASRESSEAGAQAKAPAPWWSHAIKGFCMGCADVVPGVSGGTVALVTGIYDRLVNGVQSVVAGLLLILRFRFKAGLARMDLAFLIPLMLGVMTAIVSMAKLITKCMTEIPELTWGLFLGLMLGSVVIVGRMVESKRLGLYCLTISSAMLAYLITISSPVETPETQLHFFMSGAIAIVAMILPGISGSFLLLIMGKYLQVMASIKGAVSSAKDLLLGVVSSNQGQVDVALQNLMDMGLGVMLPFAMGCATGLAVFSWILGWMLKHYRDMVLAILLGLMLGTLHKLWPIRVVTAYLYRPDKADKVLQDKAVMPYLEDPMHLAAMAMIVVGFVVVLWVERKARV